MPLNVSMKKKYSSLLIDCSDYGDKNKILV